MRIMSQVQPDDSSVTSDTKETMDCIMQFSVTLTLAAMQEGRRDRHLTITDANLIVGCSSLGLVDYVQLMTEYLRLYHDDPKGSKPLEEYTIPKGTITRILCQVLPQDPSSQGSPTVPRRPWTSA
ncbi:hypothetical protein BDA96_10G034300 [Sorghum bicolor]|uniref:Transcription factor CBF/NF-Y/archaeal histone domain-containing protein n=1 Tax=Sorghum bicolor TaxID=4558 RepID=A0A921Q2R0_SORBI|nr:hypothetical protein BDA96_10G034300 [Sorghum bicolor]